jgi:hypothetical protein
MPTFVENNRFLAIIMIFLMKIASFLAKMTSFLAKMTSFLSKMTSFFLSKMTIKMEIMIKLVIQQV